MRIYDIIDKKRHGLKLSREEIEFAISSYMNGEVADYQMSSLLMAICINSMDEEETNHLTKAMVYSAFRLGLTAELFKDIPPMVYDESFVYFDKTRLTNALNVLNEHCNLKNAQAFILTCSDREWEILCDMDGVQISKIEL